MFDSIQMLFVHTYTNVTFLMMYGAMWWFNIRFDTRFFAIASCLLVHLRLTVVHIFSAAVKDFVHYIAAQRRIQVSFVAVLNLSMNYKRNIYDRHSFYLMNPNEIIDYYLDHIQNL